LHALCWPFFSRRALEEQALKTTCAAVAWIGMRQVSPPLQTNLYRVNVNNYIFFDHDFQASGKGNGYTTQLTVAGAYLFAVGEQRFVIDGYVDWRALSNDAGIQTSVSASIHIKWDAGKALLSEERMLYIGTELNM
jgi:hypothetical protein